jgi:hypothetical protein
MTLYPNMHRKTLMIGGGHIGNTLETIQQVGNIIKKTLKFGFGEKHIGNISQTIFNTLISMISMKRCPKEGLCTLSQTLVVFFFLFFQFCDVMEVAIIYNTI